MGNKNLPFWLLLLSLCLVLVVYPLIQDGMFMDGMIYTAVGKNLANGLGTFWHPHFAKALMPVYHEQPPLMFGMEAVFFWLLGNSMYVERLYAFIMFLISGFLIHLIWRQWFINEKAVRNFSWFPLILWVIVPVVYWAVSNNVEENTMVAFVLASFYSIQRGVVQGKYTLLWLLAAGLFILGAGLCKGVQGMFTVSVVFFYWLFFRRLTFIQMVKYSLVLIFPTVVFAVIAYLSPEIERSFQMYYTRRIVNTFINTGMATTQFRYYLAAQLFNELIPSLVVLLVVLVTGWKMKYRIPGFRSRLNDSIYLIFIGLSGSMPLLITLEQRRFYLVTAMPFFILAITIYAAPVLSDLMAQLKNESRGFRVYRWVVVVLLTGTLAFSLTGVGKTKRDAAMIGDVHLIGAVVGQGSLVSIQASLFEEWALHAYFNRYYYVSLTTDSTSLYLIKNANDQVVSPETYDFINLPTERYKLYRKKSTGESK